VHTIGELVKELIAHKKETLWEDREMTKEVLNGLQRKKKSIAVKGDY